MARELVNHETVAGLQDVGRLCGVRRRVERQREPEPAGQPRRENARPRLPVEQPAARTARSLEGALVRAKVALLHRPPVVPLLVPEGDPAGLGVRLDRQQRILVGRERRWVLIVVASRVVPVAEVAQDEVRVRVNAGLASPAEQQVAPGEKR